MQEEIEIFEGRQGDAHGPRDGQRAIGRLAETRGRARTRPRSDEADSVHNRSPRLCDAVLVTAQRRARRATTLIDARMKRFPVPEDSLSLSDLMLIAVVKSSFAFTRQSAIARRHEGHGLRGAALRFARQETLRPLLECGSGKTRTAPLPIVAELNVCEACNCVTLDTLLTAAHLSSAAAAPPPETKAHKILLLLHVPSSSLLFARRFKIQHGLVELTESATKQSIVFIRPRSLSTEAITSHMNSLFISLFAYLGA